MNFTRAKKNLIKAMSLSAVLLVFAGCGAEKSMQQPETNSGECKETTFEFEVTETEEITNTVQLTMTDGRSMIIELYPDIAPITVENFQNLVSEKFYDGLIFHRVAENFVIQTGDPTGTGTGGSEKKIKGEFGINGVNNTLSHKKGVVSMARLSGNNDSASSQFFICLSDCSASLDGQYAAFGKVIGGMETVDEIGKVKTSNQRPVEEQKIKTVRFVKIEK